MGKGTNPKTTSLALRLRQGGNEDGSLRPLRVTTRCQAAAARAAPRIPKRLVAVAV